MMYGQSLDILCHIHVIEKLPPADEKDNVFVNLFNGMYDQMIMMQIKHTTSKIYIYMSMFCDGSFV